MSGGYFDYMYFKIEDVYDNKMEDNDLNELISDLVELLHDFEYYKSSDYSEEQYNETKNKFKNKWRKHESKS